MVLAQLLIQVQQPLSLKDDELNRNYTNMQNSSVIQGNKIISTLIFLLEFALPFVFVF